jgi:hypothetical protein
VRSLDARVCLGSVAQALWRWYTPYRKLGRNGLAGLPPKKTAEPAEMGPLQSLSCEPSAYATTALINKGLLRDAELVTNMYEDCFTLADASTDPTKIEGSPRGRLNMEDEVLSWHIPMTTRALGVGTDGHSTKTGVGQGLTAAECIQGQLSSR